MILWLSFPDLHMVQTKTSQPREQNISLWLSVKVTKLTSSFTTWLLHWPTPEKNAKILHPNWNTDFPLMSMGFQTLLSIMVREEMLLGFSETKSRWVLYKYRTWQPHKNNGEMEERKRPQLCRHWVILASGEKHHTTSWSCHWVNRA